MVRLIQLRNTCNHGNTCPTLHYEPVIDEFLVQGYIVNPQALAGLTLPDGHTVVRVPTTLLPELQLDPDAQDLLVRGAELTDAELLTELNLPPGEAAVRLPGAVLPALRKDTCLC